MSRFCPICRAAFLLGLCLAGWVPPSAADSTGVFCIHGTICIGWVASWGVPYARVRFYHPQDTATAVYETRADSVGRIRICPFDSGTYRIVFEANVSDDLRRTIYEYNHLCVPRHVSNVLPSIALSRKNSGFTYGMIDEMSPFHPPDTASCREEFREEMEYRVHK